MTFAQEEQARFRVRDRSVRFEQVDETSSDEHRVDGRVRAHVGQQDRHRGRRGDDVLGHVWVENNDTKQIQYGKNTIFRIKKNIFIDLIYIIYSFLEVLE